MTRELYPMTSVVARRILERQGRAGATSEIVIEIGKPARDRAPDGHWYCPYRIIRVERTRVVPIFGIDSMQALIMALALLSTEVAIHGEKEGWRWLGGSQLG